MLIRKATVEDAGTLARLNRTVQTIHVEAVPKLFRGNASIESIEQGFREMINEPNSFWLLAENPQPVGYLYATFREREETWFRPAHRICNINHLSVESVHQRSGIARALLNALLKEAASREYERIELDVWSFNNNAKMAFQRLGFRVFNERMVYIHE